jgi:hypothetical protein
MTKDFLTGYCYSIICDVKNAAMRYISDAENGDIDSLASQLIEVLAHLQKLSDAKDINELLNEL